MSNFAQQILTTDVSTATPEELEILINVTAGSTSERIIAKRNEAVRELKERNRAATEAKLKKLEASISAMMPKEEKLAALKAEAETLRKLLE